MTANLCTSPARAIILSILCLASLVPAGCGEKAKIRQEINFAFKQFMEGIDNRDGQTVANVLAKPALDYYAATLKLAMDADHKKCASLPPTQQWEILTIRVRAKRSEIAKLDGKGYVAMAVSKGWWPSWEEEWALRDIKVDGDKATAVMHDPVAEKEYKRAKTLGTVRGSGLGMGGGLRRRGLGFGGPSIGFARPSKADEPPTMNLRLIKENGTWKIDETSLFKYSDEALTAECNYAQRHIRDYLMDLEMDRTGEQLPTSIWNPMPSDKPSKKK